MGNQDFDLTIHQAGSQYVVDVESPAGEVSAPFVAPQSARFAELLQAAAQRSLHGDEAKELGSALFDALMSPPVQGRYRESRGMIREQQERLTVSLCCDIADIAALPWEFLYDPVEEKFLGSSLESSLVRYVSLPTPRPPTNIYPPLRLLLVTASPAGLPQLDSEDEIKRIRRELRPLQQADQLDVKVLPHATPEGLQQALSWQPHLLHLIAHGQDRNDGRTGIILEDKYGDPVTVPADDVASLLSETGVHCVLLMACHTADGGLAGVQGPAGLGPALVHAGVPAVVTMRQELPDQAALEFSTAFYKAITAGQPVGLAVNTARRDMRLAGGQEQLDWAVPVLHTRYPGGNLVISPERQPDGSKIARFVSWIRRRDRLIMAAPIGALVLGVMAFALFSSGVFSAQQGLGAGPQLPSDNVGRLQMIPCPDQSKTLQILASMPGLASGTLLCSDGVPISRDGDLLGPSAGITRLVIAAEAYQQMSEGRLHPAEQITVKQTDVVGGTGVLQSNVGRQYSLDQVINYMLSDSDNTAGNILIDRLGGFSPINDFAIQLGLRNTQVNRKFLDTAALARGIDNVTTTTDMANFLLKLSRGKVVNVNYSSKMLETLQTRAQTDRDWMLIEVPPSVPAAHMNGNLATVRTDAALINSQRGAYVLVVMVQTADVAGAEQSIRQVGNEIFQLVTTE